MIKNHDEPKTCTNCLLEYFCDWKPAGDRPCCEEWKSEGGKHEKSERVELIRLTIDSLKDSIAHREDIEAQGGIPNPGYNIDLNDSKTSIIRRCRLAREELNNLIRELG